MARKTSRKTFVRANAGNVAPVKAAEAAEPVSAGKEEEIAEKSEAAAAAVTLEAAVEMPVSENTETPVEEPKRKGRKPGTKNKGKEEAAANEKTENVFVEASGFQYNTEDIVANVRAAWVAEGHRAATIKKLNVYINMDERKAYYVINEKATGSVEL